MAKHMGLVDIETGMVKNFALLMFFRNPEKFIPYAYVELIHKSASGESVMSSKEFRGPIWKQLKNAMAENGSDDIQYQEYDENVDITSVVIPISKKYLQYSYKAMDLAMKDQNPVLEDQNLDFDGQKPTAKDKNFGFDGEKIKINSVDIVSIINKSAYSNTIRKTLTSIYDRFFNDEFSRSDIVSYLNASKSGSSNYVRYLQELNVVEQVKGKGKGKYKFK